MREEAKGRSCCPAERAGFGRCEGMESFQEGKGRGSEHGGRSDWTSGQELERDDCGAPRDGGRIDWASDQELDRDDAVLD